MVAKLHAVLKSVFGRTDTHIEGLECLIAIVRDAGADLHAFAQASGKDASSDQIDILQGRIVTLERMADTRQKDTVLEVSHALLLPFDRSYLFRLLNRADDIIDNIRKASTRSVLYQMAFSSDMIEMVTRTNAAITILCDATSLLKNVPKNAKALMDAALEVRHLERQVDTLHMQILQSLLVRPDAKDMTDKRAAGCYIPEVFTPMRECVDRIEKIMDSCKHYAEAIEIVVTDNA